LSQLLHQPFLSFLFLLLRIRSQKPRWITTTTEVELELVLEPVLVRQSVVRLGHSQCPEESAECSHSRRTGSTENIRHGEAWKWK
jgi:hypothetical protein